MFVDVGFLRANFKSGCAMFKKSGFAKGNCAFKTILCWGKGGKANLNFSLGSFVEEAIFEILVLKESFKMGAQFLWDEISLWARFCDEIFQLCEKGWDVFL